MLTDMLITMTDRGPDSAGLAIYNGETNGKAKLTIQSDAPDQDFSGLSEALKNEIHCDVSLTANSTHAVLEIAETHVSAARMALRAIRPNVRVMSFGASLEIYKEVGLPSKVTKQFGVSAMSGSHGIGHTRMATESKVTTFGAHPFSTGSDQCLVHNGSLSNHNLLRRKLSREGIEVETDNDSEVAAAYLTWQMAKGLSLEQSLQKSLTELDGFYTFLVGTKNGFGVLRDPIACKPAIMAETQEYVAFGSEYRAFAKLPEIQSARVWEPEPATVYFWEL